MDFPLRRPLQAAFLSLCCSFAVADGGGDGISTLSKPSVWARMADSTAWGGPGYWRALVSPVTQHYRYNEEHQRVWAIGVERQCDDAWLAGGSYFSNSFGQPSGYLYVGQRTQGLWTQPQLFFQWSAGLLYGYRGKYEHKVPLNVNGFAPGALVTLGWQFDRRSSVAVHALGDAGLMLQLAYDIR
jgi:hypothetical protein